MWRVHVDIVSIGVCIFVAGLGIHHVCVVHVIVFSFGVIVVVVFFVIVFLVVVGFVIEDGARITGGAGGAYRRLRRVIVRFRVVAGDGLAQFAGGSFDGDSQMVRV